MNRSVKKAKKLFTSAHDLAQKGLEQMRNEKQKLDNTIRYYEKTRQDLVYQIDQDQHFADSLKLLKAHLSKKAILTPPEK